MRKIGALCAKDAKTIFHNLFVLSGLLVVPVLAMLMTIGSEPEQVIILASFLIPMNVLLNGANIICVMIAEEKEKHTLNVLVASTVSGADFLISKVLVATVLTLVSNAVVFQIMGLGSVMPIGSFLLVTGVTILPVAAVGAIIGIVCKTQTAASTVVAPIMILLVIMPPLIPESFFTEYILRYAFSEQMNYGLSAVFNGESYLANIGVIAANFAVLAAVFWGVYKKRGLL